MKIKNTFYLFLFLFFSSSFSFASSLQDWQTEFQDQIKKIPKNIDVSIKIEKLGSGEVVAEYKANESLVPASGMKILTSAAALSELKPGKTIKTLAYKNGNKLILQGFGDPFLVSEKLWLLARDIENSGNKSFPGGVYINNSYFDNDEGDLVEFGGSEPYTARLSATSLNFNSLEVKISVQKQANGQQIAVASLGPVPHDYAVLETNIKVGKGSGKHLAIESLGMKNGKEVFRVTGSIGADAIGTTIYSAVKYPAAYVGNVLVGLLKNFGISTGGYKGTTELTGDVIAQLESNPLDDLVKSANTYSNNFMAEQIFRILGAEKFGAPATNEKGKRAVTEYIKTIPACASPEVKVGNGSGLNWETSVSANCLVAVLQKNYHSLSGFAELIASMPIANQTGTLKNRFNEQNSKSFDPDKLRAKTGTLWKNGAVTSMTGISVTKNGEPLVFSIIQNHQKEGYSAISKMRSWEENLLKLLQKLEKVSPDAATIPAMNNEFKHQLNKKGA